jgi:hypothetical protein
LKRPRHHCRDCGDIVCDACSPHRRWRSAISVKRPVRVCNVCELKRVNVAKGRVDLRLNVAGLEARVKRSVRGDFYLRVLCNCNGVPVQEHRVALKRAGQRQRVGSVATSMQRSLVKVSFCTVTFRANPSHNLTRSP